MTPPRPVPPPKLRKWRRVRSEAAGSYRILDVVKVSLEDGAGKARGDAFTVRCNDWCNVVAVTPDDEIVLVWQYRFGSEEISLEIPGGVIDAGEAPEHAARRELREETGYEADDLELLLVIEPNPAIQNNRCYTYVARGARPTAATGFDPQEELETTLLPVGRIPELLDAGQVSHALVQGALEAFWRKRSESAAARGPGVDAAAAEACERLLVALEEQQVGKVIDLARRLRPDLTLEDVRNPHDFPELDDRDWQYEDGILTGVQTALAAVRAMRRDAEQGS
jgi:8-oxo-dGTP pyrophosphatase MutT (NUDIX family)